MGLSVFTEGNFKAGIQTLVVGTAGAVAQNATVYSASTNFDRSNGFTAALISTTAGSITVTQQCSVDGTNWYDPVDESGNALGAVAAAMTVGTKYIQFAPVLAPFLRFKVVEGNVAATVVTIKLVG